MYRGRLVEVGPAREIFERPAHPYTRALLSAIPMPDPDAEKAKVLQIYDPSIHNYAADPPCWSEIEEGHFIMANAEEMEEYRRMLLNNAAE